MRRALASLLLAFLSFPLVTPLVLAHSVVQLPACCRRDGKHHCAMAGMAGQQMGPAGAGLQGIQSKCPLFPQSGPVPFSSKIAPPCTASRIRAQLSFLTAVPGSAEDGVKFVLPGSVPKRGPPPIL